MDIAARVRVLREQRELSQKDVEARTGLLRCYISRVEHGHSIPSVETLEKLARAFDLKLYQLLYDGDVPPQPAKPRKLRRRAGESLHSFGKRTREFDKLYRLLPKISEADREVLLFAAIKMVSFRKRGNR